jgi:hypothetical protein
MKSTAAMEAASAAVASSGIRRPGEGNNRQGRNRGSSDLFQFRHFRCPLIVGAVRTMFRQLQFPNAHKSPSPQDIKAEAFHGIISAMTPAKGCSAPMPEGSV